LFYVDPPYPLSVRHRKYYRHELTSDDDHEQLADVLHSLNGMVILSGYDCDLYQRLYPDWQVVHRRAVAQNGSERVETLWLNPAVSDALEAEANAMPPLLRLIRDAAD
jgi:DNA adenine methylase